MKTSIPELRRNSSGSLPKNSRRVCAAGFTLIELVLVIVVLSMTAIPVSLILVEHVEAVVESSEGTIARQLARAEMERINNLPYNTVASSSTTRYWGYDYDVVTTVSYAAGNGTTAQSLKLIRVEVRKTGQATSLLDVVTYRCRGITHGA